MRGNADRTKPAARGDGRSGRQLHQSLDFSHAIVDPFGPLAAEVHHETIDPQIGVFLHPVHRHRHRRRDDDLEVIAALSSGLGELRKGQWSEIDLNKRE